MCGIVGDINFNNQVIDGQNIQNMMKKIKHRGPDDEGVFIEDSIGLGFVRLSIIDISTAGHQPMVSSNNRFVVIFNGEIFNYIELRDELKDRGYKFRSDSDTEVLLNSYQEWGEECLDRFNGMWAFVIYDRETKDIFGARDRFGIKPLYYYMDSNRFLFASEIKALRVAIDSGDLSINEEAIFNYLLFNRTDYGAKTFYNEIYRVPHGHCFRVNSKKEFKLRKWYDLSRKCNRDNIDSREYLELLTSSIKLRMRSDVPVGVSLSGGLDSSTIISTISKKLNIKDINSFSAIYGRGKKGDESEFIDEMSLFLNNMHYTKPTAKSLFNDIEDIVEILDEPVPTTSIYAQYKVMELAREYVTVMLDGQGADEQLAGYPYFYGFYFRELLTTLSLKRLSIEMFNYIRIYKSLYGVKSLIFFLLPNSLKLNLKGKNISYIESDFFKKHNSRNILTDELYSAKSLKESLIKHFEYKLEHLLKWEDLNSMRFSIESRVPFLDYRVVEQTLSLTNDNYIRKGVTKYILRESVKSIVPEKIRRRYEKVGFSTPEADWFRETFFKEMINGILENPAKGFKKYIDTNVAKSLYAQHLNHKRDCSRDIWKWINLNLWLENNKDIL